MGYRTWARAILLGWLAAEWFGILVAYSFAVLVLTFLLGLLLIDVLSAGTWLIPVLAAVALLGLFLAWNATAIPREMIRRARPPRPTDAPSGPRGEASPRRISRWEVSGFLSRMSATEEGSSRQNRPIRNAGTLDRFLPGLARAPIENPTGPMPIPPLSRIGVTSNAPVRIVDLSQPPTPAGSGGPAAPTWVRTRENPGRIRQA